MKKLNRKGFTLIELLAVIVILAIIVVVTVPTIINTISDARVSSIWNLAGSTANSYDTLSAQDLLASDKVLAGVNVSGWTCISKVTNASGKTLDTILGLSGTDLVLTTTDAGGSDTTSLGTAVDSGTGELVPANISQDTCSAIRVKDNGAAEVLLVAKSGGKFAISGKTVYGLSSDDNGTAR